jgi:iron complex transport system substrate-binding protein
VAGDRTRRRSALALALVVVLAVGLVVSACGAASSVGTPEAGAVAVDPVEQPSTPVLPVTVESADGRRVTVTDVSRILPVWGNLSEVVFGLGLGDQVVGRDVGATFPGTDHLPIVTRAHDVSAEAVLSLEPTIVLAQTDTGPPEALDQIRAAGVPVVVFDIPAGIDDIDPRIRAVAAALGVPDAGDRLVARTDAEMAEVTAAIPDDRPAARVAFLYVRGAAGVYLLGGRGSGVDSLIAAAGGEDAGTAIGLDRQFTALTSEALVDAAPDVLLLTATGLESVGGVDGLLAMPGIAQTPAAADRRVITMDDGVLFSFGSRTPVALAELVDKLYDVGGAEPS